MNSRSLFYHELAKLLRAGIGAREAARILLESRPTRLTHTLATGLAAGVAERKSITEALTGTTVPLSDLEETIISAGERGGNLPSAFQHLADYFDLVSTTRKQFISALIYPLIILHIGLAVASFPSNFLTESVTLGLFLQRFITNVLIAYAILGVIALTLAQAVKAGRTSPWIDRSLSLLPYFGKARRKLALARFTQVYHICLLAALNMVETVTQSGRAASSGTILKASHRIAESARAGQNLGPAFIDSGAFPPAFSRSYASAEVAGALDTELKRWSLIFREEAEHDAKALATHLPKLLYVGVVLFVAYKIISLYSGYVSSMDQLFDDI